MCSANAFFFFSRFGFLWFCYFPLVCMLARHSVCLCFGVSLSSSSLLLLPFSLVSFSDDLAMARILFTNFVRSLYAIVVMHNTHSERSSFRAHFSRLVVVVVPFSWFFKWPDRMFCLITYIPFQSHRYLFFWVVATVFVVGDSHLGIYWAIVRFVAVASVPERQKSGTAVMQESNNNSTSSKWHLRVFGNVETSNFEFLAL